MSWRTPVPSPRPSPSRPRSARRRPSPRRGAARAGCRPCGASCSISSGEPKACCESSISSARCSAVIELSIRWAAAARWARESSSSSTLRGFSGKKSPCLAMKSSKSCWVSSPEPVLLQQLVEVAEHLVDRGAVLVRGALQRLLHAREALVEHLAAEQVLDLLVGLTRLAALPVVRRQLADRGRRRRRQVVQLHLAQRPVAVVHHHVAGELLALLEHGLVEQLLDLLQGAVEVVPLGELAPLLGDPAGEVVEAGLARAHPRRRNSASPARGCSPGHHVLADGVERLGEVDRRGERVGAAGVPAVAGVGAAASSGDRPQP